MPFVKLPPRFDRFRLLISGFSQTGKTHSLATFIYGPYDYRDPAQQADALAYAAGQQKHMVILECPGETGHRTLLPNNDYMTSYYLETAPGEDINSASWSQHTMMEFQKLYTQVVKDKPDFLALDGIPGLWHHWMNSISQGEYLSAVDMDINPATGQRVQYRAAKLHNRTHTTFDNFIDKLYRCHVPYVICTTREEWESGTAEGERPGDIGATRYLWPNVPGKMAKEIVGKFDARLSARLEALCYHADCRYKKERQLHHVWQFYPKKDVQGVAIKGLHLTENMKRTPWIHQNYADLQALLETFHR